MNASFQDMSNSIINGYSADDLDTCDLQPSREAEQVAERSDKAQLVKQGNHGNHAKKKSVLIVQ